MKFTAGIGLCMTLMMATATAEEPKADSGKPLMTSNRMLGASIYDAKENAIAEVHTVILDNEAKPVYIIAGVGGVVGIGESEVLIPWSALKCECMKKDGKKVCRASISMTEEKLSEAPQLRAAEYAELSDQKWLATNAEYYSQDAPKKPLKQSEMVCVKSVTGLEIHGPKQETVGQLDALIMDPSKPKACYAIVGYGGTVGIGQTHVAVPYSALRFSYNKDGEPVVATDLSGPQVRTAPKVTPGDYPELDLKSVRDRIEDVDQTQT